MRTPFTSLGRGGPGRLPAARAAFVVLAATASAFTAPFPAGAADASGDVSRTVLQSGQKTFTPGVYLFVVPAGVTRMTVRVWGRGGTGRQGGAGGPGYILITW
ncbi:hypothetical protein ACFU7Z_09860 [Kitasatospora sp. NPDC057518]|uniref:hypothetical protein n=1 Tax=Kitasatospora sp. NPDC057518 TaxID=3346155 RepID=UPI00367C8A3B